MKRAVIVGGFAEHRAQLEPVGHAVCELGLADDADVFTFLDAMNSDGEVERALRGQTALTHSAGIMAVQNGSSPEELHVYNGPEPRTALGLVFSAMRKTVNHQIKVFTGPDRLVHASTIAANSVELAAHFPDNLRALHEIKKFSTSKRVGEIASSGATWVQVIVSAKDEFFNPGKHILSMTNTIINTGKIIGGHVIDGGHDELLVRPHATIIQTLLK